MTKIESFSIGNSADTLNLATELAKFIKDNRLNQNIQGKEYVQVEAWQYAGSRLGIVPIIESCQSISTDDEIKYESKVSLLEIKTGLKVGAGVAICSNREQGRKYYQEFAISSMSQTRAIGKAFRNSLAWLIRAAGYEATPFEEMDYTGNDTAAKAEKAAPRAAAKQDNKKPEITTYDKNGEVVKDQKPYVKPDANPKGVPPESKPLKVETKEGEQGYATAKQKEEIIGLLNNPAITRQEKTKMLLNINRFTEDRAKEAIANLKAKIKEREDSGHVPASVMADRQKKEILDLLKNPAMTEKLVKDVTSKMTAFTETEAEGCITYLRGEIKKAQPVKS